MMYSCSSLGVKVGGGIGTAAVGWLLKLGGFVGTATVQSESAIRMIFNLYITFPFVIGIIITVRISLSVLPSLYEDIQKIAYMQRKSTSEAVQEMMEEYRKRNIRKLREYDQLQGES